MIDLRWKWIGLALGSVVMFGVQPTVCAQAPRTLDIFEQVDPRGFMLPIPVYISGFSADAARILRQDLLFMGFEDVSPDKAKYNISGSNGSGQVSARVVERINNETRYAKAFSGPNQRLLLHTLSDGIAEAITKKPGIARRKIVFRAEVKPGISEIFRADYDGFNPEAVTKDNSLTVAPCWAGPGTVFYASYKLDNKPRIFSHELGSGVRKKITPFGGSSISPSVSPDGSKIAMILSKDGNPELYVAFANGTGLIRLTRTPADESSPCWSPDGRTILFVSRSGGRGSLYRIPATGGATQRVRTLGVPSATEPDWSPDGKWIVFTTMTRPFQVCLVKAEGGDAEPLTAGEDPVWAANSRAVIFAKGEDHEKRLFLLDVPTKQVKDVPRILLSNSQPGWER